MSNIHSQFDLGSLNTLRLASAAQHFVRAETVTAVADAIAWARAENESVHVLGGGSNVLLPEQIHGLVLQPALRGIELMRDDGRFVDLRVGAGESWHEFVLWCAERGLHGLANLALIPGSVGAAPIQNIGAYGVEVSDSIIAVEVISTANGLSESLSAEACRFAYRDSLFKRKAGRHLIVLNVIFRLDRDAPVCCDYPSLAAYLGTSEVDHESVLKAVMAIRQSKLPDPNVEPNVGSFFKNPWVNIDQATALAARFPALPQQQLADRVKLSAAWMIDALGWRGQEREGVRVHDQHALVVVNRSATTLAPVLSLADEIAGSVVQHFDVALEREPVILGAQ